MRFIISFLILVRFAWCDTSITETAICANKALITNVAHTVTTSVSGAFGSDGYYYEVWTNSESGDNKLLVHGQDATFRAEWDNPDDFLGRVGARWPGRTGQKYPAYGNMVAEFAYDRSGNGTAGERYNFIGVYGWFYNDTEKDLPLVEYYIIDDWFGNAEYDEDEPIPESTACHDSAPGWVCQKGSINVDGGEYKIYTNWRVDAPSIVGDTTFIQYFSIRQNMRKCGKISISEHFKKWESLNLKMGILFEASLLVEVQKGQGFIDFTHARILTNVPDNELNPPTACIDRTPNDGNCRHVRDGVDAPPCYVLPDNKCGLSCPADYEPSTDNQCVLPSDRAYTHVHVALWGCWALCLLFVVSIL